MEKPRNQKRSVSRRTFLQGALCAASSAALYGCGSGGDNDIIYAYSGGADDGSLSDDIYRTEKTVIRYGTSGHNCGGKCIIRAEITGDRRIVRFLTDETKFAYDGTSIDPENRNSTQARACGRCRAYRGRLYHPGRLKYPLKQTKERGDVTGFQRVTWKQALDEIADRLRTVQNEYGAEAFHALYACGAYSSPFQGASYRGLFQNHDYGGSMQSVALRLLGGNSQYSSDYSFHQGSYMGSYSSVGGFSGVANFGGTADDVAGVVKYLVLWGSNIPTTHNPKAWAWIKGIEDMKKRDPESKVLFIGPELSECGITLADEWIQIKPYTDVALICAMIHEMIVNSVGEAGQLLSEPWLTLDYLDTMVYGFFDSPGYWLNTATGEINTANIPAPDLNAATPTASGGKREFDLAAGGTFGSLINSTAAAQRICWVDPVPEGKSLSAYIMGNDDRLTKINYGTGNYMAASCTAINGAPLPRNKRVCSYAALAGSKYAYKNDMYKPKTPEWAEGITGVPADTIRRLAKLYIDAAKNGEPLWNEWAGGQLKQAEGCTTLFAIQSLLAITKNWGITGTGIANNTIAPSVAPRTADGKQIANDDLSPTTWKDGTVQPMTEHPRISVTQWHNAVKYAFGTKLKENGYTPNIPDWDWNNELATGRAYYSDGGVKALVKRAAGPGITAAKYTDPAPTPKREYFDYLKDGTNHIPVGFRFILNAGGNIAVNQHANTIDSSEMFKRLPTFGYADGKYNVDKKDAFYLVCFDNFMSPSARYADYVLPAKTAWEQEDFVTIENNAGTLYVDRYIDGPGESMSTWDFTRELIKAYGGAGEAEKFTGDTPDTTFRQIVQDAFTTLKTTIPAYNGKSWDEFLKKPIVHAKPIRAATSQMKKNKLRQEYDAADLTVPNMFNVTTFDYVRDFMFGHNWFAETETCPRQSKRFHVYSGALVWRYKNLFSAWHGHLPIGEQGQKNEDSEGQPIVYPIPMYFDYRDYFREAYGLESISDLEGRYLLTTTHDRFRAHSSQAENPYLRELTHRTIGGALYSGNDAGSYAIAGDTGFTSFPPLNPLIGGNGLPLSGAEGRASYMDIWVNDADFAGYNDGELVLVENEIGAVLCTIRKTKRCVRGYVGLHQGAWFDPRKITINGAEKVVDVGGNCNTLMASKPSRIDHGNAQQSAMVKISRFR
jgi:anaerobic selenocysteine-containing dehydrogenase